MKPDFDVGIVGWGPVGATLGNLLAQRGLSVCIFEREGSHFPLPRATHFDGEAMRLFQTMGLAEELLEDLRVHVGIRFLDADQNLLLHWPRPSTFGSQAWFDSYRFHQPNLETTLRRHFRDQDGCRAIEGANVFALDEVEDGVVVRYEDATSFALSSVKCGWVIGADGARSIVRKFMGSAVEELGSRERWLVVDLICNGPNDLPDGTVQLCDPQRPTTFARCVGDRRRWEFMVMPGDDVATMAEPPTVWKLLAPWLSKDEARIERSVVYTFYSLLVRGWRRGRLMLAGDAAHLMPPFLGQGLCSGLRDVANLAWKLEAVIRRGASADLLDSYETERSPHVREYIRLAGEVGGIIQTTDPAEAERRNRQMTAAPPVMKTIQPPLGPGLHGAAPAPAGLLSAQPMTADGRRLDDAVGYAPALLLTEELFAQLGTAFRQQIGDMGIRIVASAGADYLRALAASAVLIRPDRYILGIADGMEDLGRLVSGYHHFWRPAA